MNMFEFMNFMEGNNFPLIFIYPLFHTAKNYSHIIDQSQNLHHIFKALSSCGFTSTNNPI